MSALLYTYQLANSEEIAGYEVYAGDATCELRPDAKTLQDRTIQKSHARELGVPGHKFQWLVRLVTERKSWVASVAVERVQSDETANAGVARQLVDPDKQNANPKVVVTDSGYVNKVFLAAFVGLLTVVLLIQLRCNKILYRAPAPRVPNRKDDRLCMAQR